MALASKERCPERIRYGGGPHVESQVGCLFCGAYILADWPVIPKEPAVIPQDFYVERMIQHRAGGQKAAKFDNATMELRHYRSIDAIAKALVAERHDPEPAAAT